MTQFIPVPFLKKNFCEKARNVFKAATVDLEKHEMKILNPDFENRHFVEKSAKSNLTRLVVQPLVGSVASGSLYEKETLQIMNQPPMR